MSSESVTDNSPTFERTVNQAQDTLGQIYTYTTAHAAAHWQLHTHVFFILVFSLGLRWSRGYCDLLKLISRKTF